MTWKAWGSADPITSDRPIVIVDQQELYDLVAHVEKLESDLRSAAGNKLRETTLKREANARVRILRDALTDANRIVSMMRKHLHEDHPDCYYTVLGILNDGDREDALTRTGKRGMPK